MKTNSVRVALMRQSAWIAIVAALGMGALAPRPARALEAQELTGWWIAIDETLPKLWKQGAIAPMEEGVQIEADGTVTDRVMNFWAGRAQPYLANNASTDFPATPSANLHATANTATLP